MCVIVDTNVIGLIFGSSRDQPKEARLFYEYLQSGKITLVVGGKGFTSEITRHGDFKMWLYEAQRGKRAHRIPDAEVDHEIQKLANESRKTKLKSNDRHILALARTSGARLLYTNDRALEQDFKNRKLIPGPKGRIYKTPKHEHLLQENACSR